MEKRVVFKGWGLPLLLLVPQLTITLVFFYWPAIQTV
ncbi:MAG: glycerol-3-phosphate transporter permease, partial [Hyphomicrobiaceae bacterium]|nr:glycerol-3-phosphate transporter permease [Hyphomicrobiaceae bacterium]